MEKTKEPTLKGLIADLNAMSNAKNNRLAILGLQLYAEHYVNEIVMEQMNDSAREEVRKYLTFPQKLRILKKLGVIDEAKKRILEMLNSIRDTLVHELLFSPEDIGQRLKHAKLGFNYSWSIKVGGEVKEVHVINLEKEYRDKIKNKYYQLVVSSVVIIGILYHHLRIMRGEASGQFIDIRFLEQNGKWAVNLQVKELSYKEK